MENKRLRYSLFTCLLFLLTISLQAQKLRSAKPISSNHSFALLQQKFKKPAKEYGPAPLWVWNTKVTKTLIDTMMYGFKNNAFGGVMVHPRPGLITEYLSKDWYSLFQYTVKKGRELGLNVWIYDENSYPTGFAGGHVPEQMPESYNQGQMLRMTKASIFPENIAGIFVAIKTMGSQLIDITPQMSQEKGKQGAYYFFHKVFYKKQAGMVGPPDFPYVDLMVKGVTEKFIDVTFKGYEKVAGTEFGKTIPGIFSDEPSIPAHGAGNIRWTPDLFKVFKQTWGYDLEPNLPSLFEETGNWKKVRHNYMTTLSQLFIDRWSKPMLAYTEKSGLKWTGHYWEHGWPNPNDVPDNMAMYAYHQYPGIDMLFNQFDEKSPNAQFGNIRAVKELASVANQLGKERTLSETYGGAGWELSFKDMKRLGDWQYALGVNMLNQHLSMMTLTGARKYDYPQSFSYHAPYWLQYKTLNQYFSRLSVALAHGEQQNSTLVIEPTGSAWMYVSRTTKNARFDEIGLSFQSFVTRLEKAQVAYDLGSENIIKYHGKIVGKSFVIGKRAYTTVVIPPGMENIDAATFKLLKAYTANGGKVLNFEKLKTLDGDTNKELDLYSAGKNNWYVFSAITDQIIDNHFSTPDFKISRSPDSATGNLYHHRRKFADGHLLFFANASLTAPVRGEVMIKGTDALLMDLFTGEILDYPESRHNAMLKVHFDIPAAGSLLLFISGKKKNGYEKFSIPVDKTLLPKQLTQVIRPLENSLIIDFCDLKLKDTSFKDSHVSVASQAVFTRNGFNRNPWNHQMQFKTKVLDRDTFSTGTGFTASYHFKIDKEVNFLQFTAVVEQGGLWTAITINGHQVRPVKDKWWLDKAFSVFEIGDHLHHGENTLSVSITPMSVYAEIEPVYILGDFNLEPAKKGWEIVKPKPLALGRWDKQGLPLFGQSITYRKEIHLNAVDSRYGVQLGDWNGTVSVVKVNGANVGTIIGAPNTIDLKNHLKPGLNIIDVTVIGSLKNLLGPHHNSPVPGMVGPGHWNVKGYPPGEKYETLGYGLMEDFEILKYK